MTDQQIEQHTKAMKSAAREFIKQYQIVADLAINSEDLNGELVFSIEKVMEKLNTMSDEYSNREYQDGAIISEDYC